MKRMYSCRRGIASGVSLVTVLLFALIVQAQPPIFPIFHPLERRINRCLTCHQMGVLGAPKIPPGHIVFTNQMCVNCHARPGGSFLQVYGTFIPFALALVVGLTRIFKRFGIRNLIRDLLRQKGTE